MLHVGFLLDDWTETLEAGEYQTGACHFPLVHNGLPWGAAMDIPFTKVKCSNAQIGCSQDRGMNESAREHTESTQLCQLHTIHHFFLILKLFI